MSGRAIVRDCEAKVWGHGYWHQYPCSRKATTEVGGKHYCTQHAKKYTARVSSRPRVEA